MSVGVGLGRVGLSKLVRVGKLMLFSKRGVKVVRAALERVGYWVCAVGEVG